VSRKWERMVAKNRKSVNVVRKKQGKELLSAAAPSEYEIFKGRSWVLPGFLAAFSIFYFISFWNLYPHDFWFWFTGISYFALAGLIYLVRRPVFRIGKRTLSTRRFAGDRAVEPEQIEQITVSPHHFSIQMKEKRGRWMYTKLQHRFPMDELTAKLREFALAHNIKLKEEA